MSIGFTLDDRPVSAQAGESIWDCARRYGIDLPHLCHRPAPGYPPDGNCRVCMVEIVGERVLAASCRRQPSAGMVVRSASARARAAREMVLELLIADQPARDQSPDPESHFWQTAATVGVTHSRFAPRPADRRPVTDASHPAIAVNLDACIACGLCVRACRTVQVNDIIGMGGRGAESRPVFDLDVPLGESACVACGECVQACPTGALLEKSLLDATARRPAVTPTRAVETVCPYCGVGCQTRVHVAGAGADARIVKIDGRNGPANANRLCVKGRFGQDYIRHPHRLTVPLIRRADAPKDPAAVIDPGNPFTHFREADWDEALDAAARGLVGIRDRHGGGALAGFGSAKGSNEEAYLFQKLVRQGWGSHNVDHCTRLCHASSVAALLEGVGSGAVSAPFTAVTDSDCILVIGARPTENHPVAATFFKQARQRGATLIVADPRGHGLMRHASHPLRFHPGADVALLNAMLHVIITEDLVDHAYVAAHVDGFADLAAGIGAFSPEAMAPLTGIAPADLRAAARAYATAKRAIIFWGMGVSQHVHGTDNARCLIALALITGQIGRPGTGLHPLRGQNNVQGASDAGLIPMMLPDYSPVADPAARARFEAAWGCSLDFPRGLTVVEIMDAIHAGRVRGMYIMGENPAMSDPDRLHACAALARLEHLVVQDIFLTETAALADIILPASAHAEKLGTYTNSNREVQIGRPVLDPPGRARPDLELIIALARRMGLDWNYDGVPAVYAEMRGLMPSLAGLPFERLERAGAVTYPAADADSPGQAILFGDGFPRPGGRARIVPAAITAPDEPPDAAYPLVLTTGRLLEHWHTGTMTRRAAILDALEPMALASLHPDEAARLGLGAGDAVVLETRRGAITARLRLDPDIAPGMVFMPFAFAEAAANTLTNPALDPFGKIPEFKLCGARVRPA